MELIVAIAIVALVIGIISRVTSRVRVDVAKGTANLTNQQYAQIAMNYLRRDFLAASPNYDLSDNLENIEDVKAEPIRDAAVFTSSGNSKPILVSEKEIHMFKAEIENGKTKYTPISYLFDPVAKTLVRHSSEGEKRFNNISDVKFGLFLPEQNPRSPLVWVDMTAETYEGNNQTRTFTLNTSLVSSVLNSIMNNPHSLTTFQ